MCPLELSLHFYKFVFWNIFALLSTTTFFKWLSIYYCGHCNKNKNKNFFAQYRELEIRETFWHAEEEEREEVVGISGPVNLVVFPIILMTTKGIEFLLEDFELLHWKLLHPINLSIILKTKGVININQAMANFPHSSVLSQTFAQGEKNPSLLLSNVGRVKVKKPHLSHSVLFLPPPTKVGH